jgi:hypothetical protein
MNIDSYKRKLEKSYEGQKNDDYAMKLKKKLLWDINNKHLVRH